MVSMNKVPAHKPVLKELIPLLEDIVASKKVTQVGVGSILEKGHPRSGVELRIQGYDGVQHRLKVLGISHDGRQEFYLSYSPEDFSAVEEYIKQVNARYNPRS